MYHGPLLFLRLAETPPESDDNIDMTGKCDASLAVSASAADHTDRLRLSRVQEVQGATPHEGSQAHPDAPRLSWEM